MTKSRLMTKFSAKFTTIMDKKLKLANYWNLECLLTVIMDKGLGQVEEREEEGEDWLDLEGGETHLMLHRLFLER